jgi:hypothetical protein
MKRMRSSLLFVMAMLSAGGASALAHPIPRLAADTTINDVAEGGSTGATPVDPVVVEPIRPLFPSDHADGLTLTYDGSSGSFTLRRPEPCGAMSPFVLGLTFVSLGFLGGATRRVGGER